MPITRNADGSLLLVDDTNPSRTQTVPAGTQAAQSAAIVTFFVGVVFPGPYIDPGILAAINSSIGTATQSLPQYVNSGQYQTVANLLTNYPAGASYIGMLGKVSDLWGSVRTSMICEQDAATGYYWRPQRTDYAPTQQAAASGTLTLTPLVTAPQLLLSGTLAGNVTVTPSVANVWPGAAFRVQVNSVLGLYGISLTGLVGGGTLPLLTGAVKTMVYHSGSGWAAG